MENITGEKMNMENWNPNGGAIAFGHPNGASGARVCIFTMKELIRRGGKYGMFSSCCGGGLGGFFPAILRFGIFEIHPVFLHIPNLALRKSLSPNALAEQCIPVLSAALPHVRGAAFCLTLIH